MQNTVHKAKLFIQKYQFRRAPRRRSEYTLQALKVTTTIFKIKRVRKLKLSEMYR